MKVNQSTINSPFTTYNKALIYNEHNTQFIAYNNARSSEVESVVNRTARSSAF